MIFRMRCPRCGHIYYYSGQAYEYEYCPQCGYGADFTHFVLEVNKNEHQAER